MKANKTQMIDVSKYRGSAQFGEAYRIMCENDAHALGSVDRVLTENMIRLCEETAEYLYAAYTPTIAARKEGRRPVLEECVKKITSGYRSDEERIEAITRFTSGLKDDSDLESMQFGGTEEEIMARGSEWCTDVARVGCALSQIAGFPARMVYLFDKTKAYHGHVIIEVYRNSTWGALDTSTDVAYRHEDGKPASLWELVNSPALIEKHYKGYSTYYTTVSQFGCVAIANYLVRDRQKYDYAVSGINGYYRSILRMSEKGWPGGFRWLHGEDE